MKEFLRGDKIKKLLWAASILVAYAGLIGFTCFIFEETMQLQSFTASMYINSQDWKGLGEHIILMEKTQTVSEFWIKGFGWGNPIMWPAFLSYSESNKSYIQSLKSRLNNMK